MGNDAEMVVKRMLELPLGIYLLKIIEDSDEGSLEVEIVSLRFITVVGSDAEIVGEGPFGLPLGMELIEDCDEG